MYFTRRSGPNCASKPSRRGRRHRRRPFSKLRPSLLRRGTDQSAVGASCPCDISHRTNSPSLLLEESHARSSRRCVSSYYHGSCCDESWRLCNSDPNFPRNGKNFACCRHKQGTRWNFAWICPYRANPRLLLGEQWQVFVLRYICSVGSQGTDLCSGSLQRWPQRLCRRSQWAKSNEWVWLLHLERWHHG